MAESTFQNAWESPITIATLTNLQSLPDGHIWHSVEIADASPTRQVVEVSFNLVAVTPGAGDVIRFWVVGSDADATTPYRPGSIPATEGKLITAGPIADFVGAAGNPHHQYSWITDHTTSFRGSFKKLMHSPGWTILIQPLGMALSTGNVVRYRYMTPQTVAV